MDWLSPTGKNGLAQQKREAHPKRWASGRAGDAYMFG